MGRPVGSQISDAEWASFRENLDKVAPDNVLGRREVERNGTINRLENKDVAAVASNFQVAATEKQDCHIAHFKNSDWDTINENMKKVAPGHTLTERDYEKTLGNFEKADLNQAVLAVEDAKKINKSAVMAEPQPEKKKKLLDSFRNGISKLAGYGKRVAKTAVATGAGLFGAGYAEQDR